ncbi:MAG TPA: hypothetical protein DIT75_04525 [Rikenellaceae bacterium]|nr:hypothetical protein [Rikenellaceae bacterium]
MEKYDVNRDKFIDLMAKHHEDAGVNNVWLWQKAQEGEDIMPLARKFIAGRLEQCVAAWECAAGVWRLDKGGMPERDPGKWDWEKLVEFLMVTLEEDVV